MTTGRRGGLALIVLLGCLAVGPLARQPLVAQRREPEHAREQYWAERTFPALARGHAAKRAATAATGTPTTEGLLALMEQGRRAEAIDVLRTAAASTDNAVLHDLLTVAARNSHLFFIDQSRDYNRDLNQVLDLARQRLATLPREEAASLARSINDLGVVVTNGGATDRTRALQSLVDEYPATRESLLAQVDLITSGPGVGRDQLEQLDRFWRDHPASEAGAKALFQKGWQLANNTPVSDVQKDPTERLVQIAAIVDDLELGPYPACEWVRRAPQLLSQLYVGEIADDGYEPGNVERSLAVYQRFVDRHFVAADAFDPFESPVGYVIRSRMTDLYRRLGDRDAGVERTLASVASHGADKAEVELFRAQYWIGRGRERNPPPEADRNARIEQILIPLAVADAGYASRKALVLLAQHYRDQKDLPRAIAAYERFVARYPASPFASLAALFAAQCREESGDPPADVIAAYRRMATMYQDEPLARMVGQASAGQVQESIGDFVSARDSYRVALEQWDTDYPDDVTPPGVPGATGELRRAPRNRLITRQRLIDRFEALDRNALAPDGGRIERGRWLLEDQQYESALAALREAEGSAQRPEAGDEARLLRHRAQVELALDRLATGRLMPDGSTPGQALSVLSRETFDASVGVARIALAVLQFQQGEPAGAASLVASAFDDWVGTQASLRSQAFSPLDADVAAVRELVFQPTGGLPMLRGAGLKDPPPTPAGYVILPPEITVRTADGQSARRVLYQQLHDFGGAIFLTADELDLLGRCVGTGGTASATTLLRQFLPAGGPSDGFHLAAEPSISFIEFTNVERTKANAAVRFGYQGATVMLEKIDGRWRAIKLVNQWIS